MARFYVQNVVEDCHCLCCTSDDGWLVFHYELLHTAPEADGGMAAYLKRNLQSSSAMNWDTLGRIFMVEVRYYAEPHQ